MAEGVCRSMDARLLRSTYVSDWSDGRPLCRTTVRVWGVRGCPTLLRCRVSRMGRGSERRHRRIALRLLAAVLFLLAAVSVTRGGGEVVAGVLVLLLLGGALIALNAANYQ